MTPTHWRDQIGPDRDEGPKPVSVYPKADDGRQAQTWSEAWAALGSSYGQLYKVLEEAAEGFAEGFRASSVDAADRAIQAIVAWRALPWYKRLWYWLVSV